MLPLFLLLTLLSQPAKADINITDTLKKLPGLKQGAAFNITDSKVEYITTIGLVKYNDFGLSGGFSSSDKAVATLSYHLGGLNKFGINTPITDLIDLEAGIYVGYGRLTGSNEFSWGPSLTIVSIKF